MCASISFMQSGWSSPLRTMHSSRGFFVSGQQQHIGLPVFMPTFCFFSYNGIMSACEVQHRMSQHRKKNQSLDRIEKPLVARDRRFSFKTLLTTGGEGVDDPCPIFLFWPLLLVGWLVARFLPWIRSCSRGRMYDFNQTV